jgi:hypothetical protein
LLSRRINKKCSLMCFLHYRGIRSNEQTIDLSSLGIHLADLQELEALFREKEVWKVIRDLPSYQALGLNGFI